MTPRFRTQLVARLIDPANGGTWQLETPLVYVSAIDGIATIIVPGGFETDFASVPRFLLTYVLTGNTAHAPAVVHDYLYRKAGWTVTRKQADDVFLEAMKATGVPGWRRWLMYAGVRAGGGGGFKERDA